MRQMKGLMVAGILLIGLVVCSSEVIWIEGESSHRSSVDQMNWLKGDNPRLLSGGDAFAGHSTKAELPKPCFVLWKFEVAKAGTYHVYFRHGWLGHMGQMRYRFIKTDAEGKPLTKPGPEEGWVEFDMLASVMDRVETGKHRTMEWTRQETVKLDAGNYLLDLQVTGAHPSKTNPSDPVWVLIDVIALVTEPFIPRGAQKPGETPAGVKPKADDGDDYL